MALTSKTGNEAELDVATNPSGRWEPAPNRAHCL